jgi:LysM repeat protein
MMVNKTTKNIRCIAFVIAALITLNAHPQTSNNLYNDYITKYKDAAIEQMLHYHIPASITLAQGLLESSAGTSKLAQKSNNHFGIKCGGNWVGPSVSQDDDFPGECFRKYHSVTESFEDHSLFLVTRPRYSSLFKLDPKDYRSWAFGLKEAGYATSSSYAQNLINIIEQYKLYQFDNYVMTGTPSTWQENSRYIPIKNITNTDHAIMRNNGNYYLIARTGDTFESIAKETGVSVRKLIRYNELYKSYKLQQGDIIYMEKKSRKAERLYINHPHIVNANESLYSISQIYGIRLKYLYKMNKLDTNYVPRQGDVLRVR